MTEEEKINDEQIPSELKEQLTKKVSSVLTKIGLIEKSINNAIEDAIEDIDLEVTTIEINAALLNVMKRINSREIMQLVK